MVKRIVIGAALALCGGCGTDPEPTKVPAEEYEDPRMGNVSGSRLRRKQFRAADGTIEFIGWYDSERKENCSFRKLLTEEHRCLPPVDEVNELPYADAACTIPITEHRDPYIFECTGEVSLARYTMTQRSTNCDDRMVAVYERGERFADAEDATELPVFLLEPDGCRQAERGSFVAGAVDRLVEIDINSFVLANVETD